MLLEISGEIIPERMKGWSQHKNNTQQEATITQDMEQWAGSQLGKKYIKDVYCHPAYLTYMPGEISTISDIKMTPL